MTPKSSFAPQPDGDLPTETVIDQLERHFMQPTLGNLTQIRQFSLKNSKLAALSCLLPLLLACLWAQAEAVPLKQATVETRLLKFPGIALDGLDYRALSFEYAVRGEVALAQTLVKTQAQQCNGKETPSEIIEVHYQGPDVLFRVSDRNNLRVVYQQKLDTSGSALFGEGRCIQEGRALELFHEQKQQWRNRLHRELLTRARVQMQLFIEQDVALRYEPSRFTLYFVEGPNNPYPEMNRAYHQSQTAFELLNRLGLTVEGQEALRGAIRSWERVMEQLPAGDNEAIEMALHRNLSVSYFALGKYRQARRHDALALARGLAHEQSIQPQLLSHERHQILSPRVAGDLVLTANLFRMGQSAVAGARLERSEYTKLEQALSQY